MGALAEMSEKRYDVGRGDLDPHVLKYAEKLRAEIRNICGKYGTDKLIGLFDGLSSGRIKTVDKKDILKISSILTKLEKSLDENCVPPPELPSAAAFEKMVQNVNEQISPLKVFNLGNWDSYRFEDGELTGLVFLSKEVIFPVIDGELVDVVKDEHGKLIKFEKCVGTPRIEKSKLNSVAMVDGVIRIVADGVLISREIDQRAVYSALEVVDGKINGMCYLGGGTRRQVPIINGEKMMAIEDSNRKIVNIVNCTNVKNIEGKLNGAVFIGESGLGLPVIDGALQETVKDKTGKDHKILDCQGIENIDGKLNGAVKLEDEIEIKQPGSVVKEHHWLPVIDGVLVETVKDEDGIEYPIRVCKEISNVNGKLNGIVGVNERIWDVGISSRRRELPVIDGKLVETVKDRSGRRRYILSCMNVRNVGGRLTGVVQISDGRFLPVIRGRLIEGIEGQVIQDVDKKEFSDAGGLFTGYVKLAPGGEVRYALLGKFLEVLA